MQASQANPLAPQAPNRKVQVSLQALEGRAAGLVPGCEGEGFMALGLFCTRRTWGPPKPRKAVLLDWLVLQRWPRMRMLGMKNVASLCISARSMIEVDRS